MPRSSGEQLQSLTPLRGLAAIWVILYHYDGVFLPSLNVEAYSKLIAKGYLAVDLFFLLSGFVLTHVYCEWFGQIDQPKYASFIRARIARLYPLHVFVLMLFVVVFMAMHAIQYAIGGGFDAMPLLGARSVLALLANLFMLQGLKASVLSWNYPAWSISVEFLAYFAFPFALWKTCRLGKAATTGVVVGLLITVAWFAYATSDSFDQWDGLYSLWRGLPEFMLGTYLYRAFRSDWCRWLRGDAAALGVATTTVLLLHLGWSDIAVVALFSVLIWSAVANEGRFARLLNAAPLLWLGEVSYSLYLVHGLVRYAVSESLAQWGGITRTETIGVVPSLALSALMIGACLVLAAWTYNRIELTGRCYLRALFGSSTPRRLIGPVPVSR
jgi:peptidoglycan/LPS O-acetylase OafA/YrhL